MKEFSSNRDVVQKQRARMSSYKLPVKYMNVLAIKLTTGLNKSRCKNSRYKSNPIFFNISKQRLNSVWMKKNVNSAVANCKQMGSQSKLSPKCGRFIKNVKTTELCYN